MPMHSADLPNFLFPPWYVGQDDGVHEYDSDEEPNEVRVAEEINRGSSSALRLGRSLLAKHELKTWRFLISSLVEGCDAWCRFDSRTIEMHPRMLERSRYRIRQLILHEVAHALCGRTAAGHGRKWIKTAQWLGVTRDHIDFNLKLHAQERAAKAFNGRE